MYQRQVPQPLNVPQSAWASNPRDGAWPIPNQPQPRSPVPPLMNSPRKVQTLEEVEAAMLASQLAASQPRPQLHPLPHGYPQPVPQGIQPPGIPVHSMPLQMQHQMPMQHPMQHQMQQPLQQPGIRGPPMSGQMQQSGQMPIPGQMPRMAQAMPGQMQQMPRAPMPIHPAQHQMTPAEIQALRMEENKKLRRAQKIGQMARYNGLMTQSEKSFILRIQISQLVSEDPESEDFYFTVHSALRGRSNPMQALDPFAQTYLMQSGQRRNNKRTDNPMLKMQQHVQRAIDAAKARQVVKPTGASVEGSLGKLSFSRARNYVLTPAPEQQIVPRAVSGGRSTKEILSNIEKVYMTLLDFEQNGRQIPSELATPLDQLAWKDRMDLLADTIWMNLKISSTPSTSHEMHPFIQLLQFSKGKKLIPRIYRSLTPERRLLLTDTIIAHLDMLDVIRQARYQQGLMAREVREEIDLFTQTVFPSLLAYVTEVSLETVTELLGLLLERNDLSVICSSKVGLSFMTIFVSRAEIIKQTNQEDEVHLQNWLAMYNKMFSAMEGKFSLIFPPTTQYTDEIYPWQFLAACAVSASPEQQHTAVHEVREKVLENLVAAKSLPYELAEVKRSNVDLFLHAIGLDHTQLEV